jgi:FtsH-binding integral membrane protein
MGLGWGIKMKNMDWNKPLNKGPLPVWVIVLGVIFFGGLFCFLSISENDYNTAHLTASFFAGAVGFSYLLMLHRFAQTRVLGCEKTSVCLQRLED